MKGVREKGGYHAKEIHRAYRDGAGAPYGWTYVGSHNLSPTAWGLPFGDGRLLQCASYELGVVMLVSIELFGVADLRTHSDPRTRRLAGPERHASRGGPGAAVVQLASVPVPSR